MKVQDFRELNAQQFYLTLGGSMNNIYLIMNCEV